MHKVLYNGYKEDGADQLSAEPALKGLVFLHIGAGSHSREHTTKYRHLVDRVLKYAQDLLHQGLHSEDVAVKVCGKLEDSPLTNAGYGSELTEDGTVECDAFITTGKTFAGISAVKVAKNPVELAHKLLQYQEHQPEIDRLLGRAPTHILSGHGADVFAQRSGCCLVDNKSLVSKPAKERFLKVKDVISALESEGFDGDIGTQHLEYPATTDTVGVICIDHYGNMTAVSSSGGITYKPPGRVGPAALRGAATFVTQSATANIGCCTSGYGEDLHQLDLARACTELFGKLGNDDQAEPGLFDVEQLLKALNSQESRQLTPLRSSPLSVGTIIVVQHKDNHKAQLLMAYTTPTMYAGYATAKEMKPLLCQKDRGYVVGSERWIDISGI